MLGIDTEIRRKTFIIGSGAQIKQDSTPGPAHLDIATRKLCSRHNKYLGLYVSEYSAGNNNICIYILIH